MSEPGVEQPVEDVLEQRRADDLPEDESTFGEPPAEADEADVVDQRIEVPLEDDRYSGGSG